MAQSLLDPRTQKALAFLAVSAPQSQGFGAVGRAELPVRLAKGARIEAISDTSVSKNARVQLR